MQELIAEPPAWGKGLAKFEGEKISKQLEKKPKHLAKNLFHNLKSSFPRKDQKLCTYIFIFRGRVKIERKNKFYLLKKGRNV